MNWELPFAKAPIFAFVYHVASMTIIPVCPHFRTWLIFRTMTISIDFCTTFQWSGLEELITLWIKLYSFLEKSLLEVECSILDRPRIEPDRRLIYFFSGENTWSLFLGVPSRIPPSGQPSYISTRNDFWSSLRKRTQNTCKKCSKISGDSFYDFFIWKFFSENLHSFKHWFIDSLALIQKFV